MEQFLSLTLLDIGLPSTAPLWKASLLTIISLLVGVLGGFVGLALGTIRLPALLLLGTPAAIAGGTNIMVSSLSSVSGALRHWREGRVDLWQGIEFIIIYRDRVSSGKSSGPLFGHGLEGSTGIFTRKRVFAEGAVGLSVGLLGGAVGLILGSIRLPALVRILKVDPRIAAGTNLFIGFFMGAVGWVGHITQDKVDYPLLVFMGVAAIAGSWYGARLTGKVNLNTLILTMGFVLIIVGVLLAYRGIIPFV